jgi:hypothetical protein
MRKTVLITSLFWIGVAAACATTDSIKTWIVTERGFEHNTDQVSELMDFAHAIGYRCYSEPDDKIWRTKLNEAAVCCNAK